MQQTKVTHRQKPIPKNPLAFAWFVAQPYRFWVILNFLAVLIAQTIESGLPLIIKLIVDQAESGRNPATIITWGGVYIGAFLIMAILWRANGFIAIYWMSRCWARNYRLLFNYLINHSHRFFSDRFAGSLGNKVNNVAHGRAELAGTFLWSFFPVIIQIVVGITLAWYANPLLASIMAAWITIFIPLNFFLVRKKAGLSKAKAESNSSLTGRIVDVIGNITGVRHYAGHHYESQSIEKFITEYRETGARSWRYSEIVLTINNLLQTVLLGGMMITALYLWSQKIVSLGDVVMIVTIAITIQDVMEWIGNIMNDTLENYGRMQEGLQEIVIPHEIVDHPEAEELAAPAGQIDIHNLEFNYGDNTVFSGLNLKILSGQKIGIVGPSGGGKSTLIDLLCRQYDIQRGTIKVDGQDISQVTQKSLRESIAIIPQEPLLFHRSIEENIGYGNLGANQEEIIEAAKMAQAHEFITQTPEGYDTLIGERGIKLSGGQRQRVAIARAFLKLAPILILDEATSSLDSESESLIQDALTKLMAEKTVIAIAHRLSTIQAMDRILVIDDGRIIQDGSHYELLNDRNGIYWKLWQKQSQGFLPN